jgi:hypothetical protein
MNKGIDTGISYYLYVELRSWMDATVLLKARRNPKHWKTVLSFLLAQLEQSPCPPLGFVQPRERSPFHHHQAVFVKLGMCRGIAVQSPFNARMDQSTQHGQARPCSNCAAARNSP